jgi:phosphomannomutase
VNHDLIEKVERWIADDPDETTATHAQQVLDDAKSGDQQAVAQLTAWFGDLLQFGTAGLRGPIAPGPSCMNRAVVMRAAQGLINYLLKNGGKKIVVGYDARHRSIDFALDTVELAAASGLEAILLPRTLPTPVLAFAVRYLKADAGVMVTASHNPPQDNGYKVYLGDGSQIVPPQDADIAAEIAAINSVKDLPRAENWELADEAVVQSYIQSAAATFEMADLPKVNAVYTPLHGVGYETLVATVKTAGLTELSVVVEQSEPDPDFPTVAFPNPEEAGATDLLLELAELQNADIAIANDPDADRCAAAIKDGAAWRLLRGDEVGVLLGWWSIKRNELLSRPKLSGVFAASIVSSTMLSKIATAHSLEYQGTLTGFKWIAKVPSLVFGYEEALGYCVDPQSVGDKDGISAAIRLLELTAWLKSESKTFPQLLDELATTYGLHMTDQLSVRMQDLAAIPAAVSRLRSTPPKTVGGLTVEQIVDLAKGWNGLPPTDGILLLLEGGQVIARPSGTEPKLKCYLEVQLATDDVTADRARAQEILAAMKIDMAKVLGV